MNKRKVAVLPILALIVLIFAVALKAQTPPIGITVHPTNLDINLTPGSPQKGTIFLRNHTKQTIAIKTVLRNFTAQGEQGSVQITSAEDTPFSLASWIKVTPEKVDVSPNQEVAFTYTVTAPENAEPGGHFGSIIFATIPSSTVTGSAGSTVSQEIATLFLARIPGIVDERSTILSFEPQKKFYEFGPVTFDLRVKDEGGVHIRPAGVVTIKSMWGAKNIVGFEGLNVLPGAIRKMPVVFNSTWLVGKYSADLALTYGSKNTQLYASTEFFAFPWKLGIAVLVILFILFFARKRILKAVKVIAKG